MPPKLPNLKYKPRRVVRPKDELDESQSTEGMEDMSLVQLERLRLQQEAALQQQQQQQQQQTFGVGTATLHSLRGDSAASVLPVDSASTHRAPRLQSAQIAASRAAAFLAPEAKRFPVNTMSKILEVRADTPGMTVYHPTPLDCTLPARLKSSDEDCFVEGDDQRVDATTQDDGVAFLKEYEEELRRSRLANMRFEREVLRASADKIDAEISMGCSDKGEFVWFQLPRFQADPPFLLTQLPSGKIGEVKVYKSGRMLMEICGVYYELAVEGYTAGGDVACNVVAAVTPSQQPDEKTSCYQLGLLEKKIVCTPSITLDK
ncbi:putative RNA polymerase III RPC4 [Trypanosoma cruzi]|nr:putative RNA polymerase III RPC4 [Trypanosoma cruzi]